MGGESPPAEPIQAPTPPSGNLIKRFIGAITGPSVLGRIILAAAVGGAIFAIPGLPVFEYFFNVAEKYEGRAAASLFLCGASVVALSYTIYRLRSTSTLDLTVPRGVNTPLGFLLAMGIGWLVGTTIFR